AVLQRVVEIIVPLVDQHRDADDRQLDGDHRGEQGAAGPAIVRAEIGAGDAPHDGEGRNDSAHCGTPPLCARTFRGTWRTDNLRGSARSASVYCVRPTDASATFAIQRAAAAQSALHAARRAEPGLGCLVAGGRGLRPYSRRRQDGHSGRAADLTKHTDLVNKPAGEGSKCVTRIEATAD